MKHCILAFVAFIITACPAENGTNPEPEPPSTYTQTFRVFTSDGGTEGSGFIVLSGGGKALGTGAITAGANKDVTYKFVNLKINALSAAITLGDEYQSMEIDNIGYNDKTANVIMQKLDGRSADNYKIDAFNYSPINGIKFFGGPGGTAFAYGRNGKIAYSAGGTSDWETIDINSGGTIADFGYVGIKDLVLAAGTLFVVGGTGGTAAYAPPPWNTWTAVTDPWFCGTAAVNGLANANNGKTILAVGDLGRTSYSTDAGLTWSAGTTLFDSDDIAAITTNGTIYVAIAAEGGQYAYSANGGTSWTPLQLENASFHDILVTNKIAAITNNGADKYFVIADKGKNAKTNNVIKQGAGTGVWVDNGVFDGTSHLIDLKGAVFGGSYIVAAGANGALGFADALTTSQISFTAFRHTIFSRNSENITGVAYNQNGKYIFVGDKGTVVDIVLP